MRILRWQPIEHSEQLGLSCKGQRCMAVTCPMPGGKCCNWLRGGRVLCMCDVLRFHGGGWSRSLGERNVLQ